MNMIAMIGPRDQRCWLAEACEIVLLLPLLVVVLSLLVLCGLPCHHGCCLLHRGEPSWTVADKA